MELGAVLREARQSLKRELSDISDELRIKLSYLQAIEDGRLDDLPGPAYAVGFVRGYATYLGLDAEDIVNRFKAAGAVKGDRTELHLPSPVTDGRLPSAAVLIVAAVLAVCAYGTWYYISSAEKSREEKIATVPSKIAESVNTVPIRPLPERGVLEAPAEVVAPYPEATPPPGEPAEPAAPPSNSSAQRSAVEPKPGPTSTTRTPDTRPGANLVPTPPKPAVEAKPPQTNTLTATRTPTPTAETPAPPVASNSPGSEVATPPAAPAAPSRARGDSRREPARSEVAPSQAARPASPTDPGPPRTGTAETSPSIDATQDGSLPWLAPAEGASATASEAPRGEPLPATSDRSGGRQAAEVDGRTQAGRARTPAPNRAAEPESAVPAAPSATMAPSPPARQSTPDDADATGPITTLQPSDEQVAMSRVVEGGHRISILARVDTWVEVRRGGGSPVFSKLMKAGEAFEVPAQPGFKLSTGNAAGIDLLVDGQRLSPLGKSGAVKKNVALDPEALLRSPGVAP
jgi:cytoskeletal protein RodZ